MGIIGPEIQVARQYPTGNGKPIFLEVSHDCKKAHEAHPSHHMETQMERACVMGKIKGMPITGMISRTWGDGGTIKPEALLSPYVPPEIHTHRLGALFEVRVNPFLDRPFFVVYAHEPRA